MAWLLCAAVSCWRHSESWLLEALLQRGGPYPLRRL
eukprot:COSAG06_NODE_63535_length_262_cov_0.625767_1_plen_35_part_10